MNISHTSTLTHTRAHTHAHIYNIHIRVESKNDFLASSPIKLALRMCYSEPLYEGRKKQLNSTTNVSISEDDISEEISSYIIYIYNIYIIYVYAIYTYTSRPQSTNNLFC